MSQARTAKDLQAAFMEACRDLVSYWADPQIDRATCEERISGALHSFLCLIDGVSSGFPCSLDLVCRPHPDDKQFCISDGEDWVEDGLVINADDLLHELLYFKEYL